MLLDDPMRHEDALLEHCTPLYRVVATLKLAREFVHLHAQVAQRIVCREGSGHDDCSGVHLRRPARGVVPRLAALHNSIGRSLTFTGTGRQPR